MKTYRVALLDADAGTVTAASMSAGDGFVRFWADGDEDSMFDPILVACFGQHQVISVREVPAVAKAVVIEEAPELPTLGRWHPVYAYGKGDLAEALRKARDMCNGRYGKESMRQGAGNYLNDILRDLIKGK